MRMFGFRVIGLVIGWLPNRNVGTSPDPAHELLSRLGLCRGHGREHADYHVMENQQEKWNMK